MATKAAKKIGAANTGAANALAAVPTPARAKTVTLRPGTGVTREQTRFIVLYGPPKCRKTGSCSTVAGAKWIVSDSNCIPTLSVLDRLPPKEDIYEVGSLADTRQLVEEMIDAAVKGGLQIPAVILDSITALADWTQQDVARDTGQRFLGENAKNNGWQQFNTDFGAFIDAITELSRHVTVIAICHAKEKPDASKGDWSGFNLPPQVGAKLGRAANWVLYQTIRSYPAGDKDESDDFRTVFADADGSKRALEVSIHTQTLGLWFCSANARHLDPEEPADLAKMLAKEGLT